jgi:hypothetical protein
MTNDELIAHLIQHHLRLIEENNQLKLDLVKWKKKVRKWRERAAK